MNRRTTLLAGCMLAAAALALPLQALATPPPATTSPTPPRATSDPTSGPPTSVPPGSGIQVGPLPAAGSGNASGGGPVNGDQASHPHFWDLPGRIRKSIDDWFKGLVLDALNPMLDLVGKSVLSTPQLASNAQVAGLWQMSLIAADGLLVLFVLVAAGLAMSYETMQTQYALKDLLRRLAFAGIVINASLSLCGQMISVSNALAAAFLGDGASAAASAGSMQTFVVGALAGGGIFLTLLGLACAVTAVVLVLLYLFRAAIVVILVCAAPLLLLCHLFPQTEGLAQLWWRAMTAAFAIQITQALVLAAAVRVFFANNGGSNLGLSVSGSVINLLLCLCLLVVLVKIPFWAKQLAFGGHGGSTTVRLAKVYAASRLLRGGF
jgi:hypothetical protein